MPPAYPSTASTFFTPGEASAARPSNEATRPPSVGHMVTVAYSMPGRSTSRPKPALPVALARASRRGRGWPMSLNCAGVFRVTAPGSGSLAAASASSPKPALRPEGWSTRPASTRSSATGTPHCAAAAATSIARADAPASRMGSHRSFMLELPPVIITPISRIVRAVMRPARRLSRPWSSGWKGRPSTTVVRLL